MADIFDWSATAANNTSIDGINTATGMSPGNVDNVFRSIAAIVRNTFVAGWEGLFAGTTSGIPVSNGAGTITAKAAPTGDIVGTTDTQTLTNKTISSLGAALAVADGGTAGTTAAAARTNLAALGLTSSALAAGSVNIVITLSDGTSLRVKGGTGSLGANSSTTLSFGATFGAIPVVIVSGGPTGASSEGDVHSTAAATTTGVAIVNSGNATAHYNWLAIGQA